jgi:hypothetical protein
LAEKDGDPQAIESGAANSASRDIWQDKATLAYLRTGSHAPGLTAAVKDWVQHRAKHYHFENNLLRKRMLAGVDKIVTEPHLRTNLIQTIHLDTGHFGIKKTYYLLEPVYTWAGMYEQVRFEVHACAACDRVKASFEVRDCNVWGSVKANRPSVNKYASPSRHSSSLLDLNSDIGCPLLGLSLSA